MSTQQQQQQHQQRQHHGKSKKGSPAPATTTTTTTTTPASTTTAAMTTTPAPKSDGSNRSTSSRTSSTAASTASSSSSSSSSSAGSSSPRSVTAALVAETKDDKPQKATAKANGSASLGGSGNSHSNSKRAKSIKKKKTKKKPQQQQQQQPQKKQQKPKVKKSVRFDLESNDVRRVPLIRELPRDVVEAVWTSDFEYRKIVTSYNFVISKMETNELLRGDPSTRGLEGRTREGYRQRFQRRHDAYNAVLDEQDRQWAVQAGELQCTYDFERLSGVYSKHTEMCAREARMRAIRDASDAATILKDMKASSQQSDERRRLYNRDHIEAALRLRQQRDEAALASRREHQKLIAATAKTTTMATISETPQPLPPKPVVPLDRQPSSPTKADNKQQKPSSTPTSPSSSQKSPSSRSPLFDRLRPKFMMRGEPKKIAMANSAA